MKVAFSEAQLKPATGGKYLPFDGTFIVRVAKLEYLTSQAGNQVAQFTLQEPTTGKTGTERITLVSQAQWKLAQFLRGCGFTDSQLTGGIEIESSLGRVLQMKRVKTGMKNVNGKDRTEFETYFNPATEDEIDSVGGHEAKEEIPSFDDDVAL